MCGRFTQSKDPKQIAKRFKVDSIALDDFKPSYNIPPSAKVPIIVPTEKGRRLESGQWGLKRAWAPQIINLQAEKLAKGVFKKNLASQRCIVPADGWYEWGTAGGKKYPVRFQLNDGELFGFPALYDQGDPKTFAIFTTAPNEIAAAVHHRMPAILLPDQEDVWLNTALADITALVALLRPFPAARMLSYPVSLVVNSPRNNSPELIKPIRR
jgi:putative SOS response-associated peptidase YedK